MLNLLIAAVIIFGGWWALRKLATAQPAQVRAGMRKAAGAGLMGAAALLALRGGLQVAAPLFALGLGMFTNVTGMMKNGAFWKKPPGQKSRVTTSVLDMELDHDTGAMDGTILTGPMQGRKLSSLKSEEFGAIRRQCLAAADQSAALFDAWLSRTHPDFNDPQSAGNASGGATSAKMTRQEALAILGLSGNPTAEDIRLAHRNLIKQFHPDRGGTDYLAAKINMAKETLL